MNVGQIIARCRADLEHAGEGDIPREDFLSWFNLTIGELSKRYPFHHLYVEAIRTITSGQARYGLPPDFSFFQSVKLNGVKLYRFDPSHYDELTGTESDLLPTETCYYIIRGTEIELVTIPNESGGTLRLLYYAVPPDFVNDNESDYITKNHPLACIYGTDFQGASYLMDSEKVSLYGGLYEMQIKKMIEQENSAHKQDEFTRVKTWKDFPLTQFKKHFKI